MTTRAIRSFLSRSRSESGVAAIELAIVLPLLMLILFGIISFGTVFYNYIVITNAAREGARWGAINSEVTTGDACTGTTNPCTVADSYANGLLINYGGGTSVTTTATVDAPDSTPIITVIVEFDFQGIGFFKTLFADGISARSSMYLEP